jgi:PAS domain S-box-containing protein
VRSIDVNVSQRKELPKVAFQSKGHELDGKPPIRKTLEFSGNEEPILILAPTGHDAELTRTFLSTSGIEGHICRNMFDLSLRVENGCGAILIAEEALNTTSVEVLVDLLGRQPSWSDIPIIIITSGGEITQDNLRRLTVFGQGGNVTLLERPFRAMTLRNAGRAALQSRRRQYQVRDLLLERETVLTSINDSFATLDREWRYTYVNEKAAELAGLTRERMLGRNIWDLFPQSVNSPLYDALHRALAEQRIIHFEQSLQKEGRWLDVRIYPSSHGLSILSTDISARKWAEQQLTEYLHQQQKLFQFVDCLNRTESLPEIYDAALDSICSTLKADRASILLYDQSGIMRFKAWRSLSEPYRKGVEGHSPWRRDEPDPQPVCIEDIEAVALEESLRTIVRQEGIRSLAFIPLLYQGELLGKFMVYYDAPHGFADEELQLAQTIANQLAFAVQRKRSDEALQEGRQHLEFVTNASPVLLAHCDANRRYKFVNQPYAQRFDLGPAEVVGKFIWEVVGVKAYESFRKYVDEVLTGRQVEFEAEVPYDRIGSHWVRGFYAPEFDHNGNVSGLVGAIIDITDRKRIELELAQVKDRLAMDLAGMNRLQELSSRFVQQDNLQLLYEEIVDAAIAITNAEKGNIQLLDPNSETLIMVAQRGFDRPFTEFFKSVAEPASCCGTALKSGRRVIIEDVRQSPTLAGQTSQQVLLEAGVQAVQSTPLFSRSGKILGMLSTHFSKPHYPADRELRLLDLLARQAADFIERTQALIALRKAQAEIRRHAENLEVQVNERTAQLTEINEQLEALVYSIAHDLRAPLRSMQAFSSILIEQHASGLDDAGRQLAERIARSAEFMDSLLLDLLAYGRMARVEMPLSAVKVQAAWTDALRQNEQIIQEKKAIIDTVQPLPLIVAHEPTLVQVLANLLNNALKFVQPEVTPRIRFRAEGKSDRIRLWLEDNGIGIAPEYQERIFRVFERLHGTTYSGTGIGLSIVRKGVERMGGKVGLKSTPGTGSRFWVEFPAAG